MSEMRSFLRAKICWVSRFPLRYPCCMAVIRFYGLVNMARRKYKMYKKSKALLLILTVFFINGCSSAANKTLFPPSDTQWVNVEIKNPSPYTKPFPLEIRYISHKCLKKRVSGFDGSVITEPSYNVIQVPLQQHDGDIWKGQIAMTGGGSCQWTLSAMNLGIEYIEATHLGKDLVPGTAVGATIAFDDDASRNGQYTSTQGDIFLSPNYYPYIREWKLIRREKELTILGKERFLLYRVSKINRISFSPKLNEKKIVKYIEPERKTEGVYAKIIYPDGSVAPNRTLLPDFDVIDKMKIK